MWYLYKHSVSGAVTEMKIVVASSINTEYSTLSKVITYIYMTILISVMLYVLYVSFVELMLVVVVTEAQLPIEVSYLL